MKSDIFGYGKRTFKDQPKKIDILSKIFHPSQTIVLPCYNFICTRYAKEILFLQSHTLPQLLRASTLLDEDDGFSSLEVSDLSSPPPSNRASTPPPTRTAPKVRSKVSKSASMKLKWFPAFRLGGSNHSTTNNSNNGNKESRQPASQTGNAGGGNSRLIKKTASTASLVRRSSSRLNITSDVALNPSADDYGCSATPILLSVRKRSTSDSGYSGNSGEDYTSSSHCGDDSPVVPSAKPRPNINGLSFLRLFHKSSATLQLQHPKTELNPDKPYKGQVTTAADHQMRKKSKDYLRGHKRKLVPMASSSLSSLNTINSQPLVHQPAANAASVSGTKGQAMGSGASNGAFSSSNSVASDESSCANGSSSTYDSGAFSRTSSPDLVPPLNLSLSMSRLALTEPLVAPKLVLAATRGEWPPVTPAEYEAALNSMVAAAAASAAAPKAVRQNSSSLKKKPLNMAERNRQLHRRQMRARSMSAAKPGTVGMGAGGFHSAGVGATSAGLIAPDNGDVTVTVGSSTLLTIGINKSSNGMQQISSGGTTVVPCGKMNQHPRSSNLRRSRSGLPVLGTTALNQNISPMKPMRSSAVLTSTTSLQRNKISTVYLEDPSGSSSSAIGGCSIPVMAGPSTVNTTAARSPAKRYLERSGSVVTVMGSQPSTGIKCDCTERVTVNGQHHCAKPRATPTAGDLKVDRSTNTTPNPPGSSMMKSTLIHL